MNVFSKRRENSYTAKSTNGTVPRPQCQRRMSNAATLAVSDACRKERKPLIDSFVQSLTGKFSYVCPPARRLEI